MTGSQTVALASQQSTFVDYERCSATMIVRLVRMRGCMWTVTSADIHTSLAVNSTDLLGSQTIKCQKHLRVLRRTMTHVLTADFTQRVHLALEGVLRISKMKKHQVFAAKSPRYRFLCI